MAIKSRRAWIGFLAITYMMFVVELIILFPDAGKRSGRLRPNFNRIREGMTSNEVQQIMGKDRGAIPAGHSLSGPGFYPRSGNRGSTWFGPDMVVQVWFSDEDDRVTGKEHRPVVDITPESGIAPHLRLFWRRLWP